MRIGKVKGLIPLDESGIDPEDPYALNKFRALANREIQLIILRYSMEAEMFVASRKKAREITAGITLSKIKEGYNIYCVVREVEKGHLIGDIVELTFIFQPLNYHMVGWMIYVQCISLVTIFAYRL